MILESEYQTNQESETQDFFVTIDTKEDGTTYSDLAGRYPFTSSCGNQYIVILYYYDNNSIQAMPNKTRNTEEIRDTPMSMLSTLTNIRHQPNTHILDNEASSIIKQGLLKHKIQYHWHPPHLHIRNVAERAIQMFKANFITCLCAAYPNYPAKDWDHFIPQSALTLNLL